MKLLRIIPVLFIIMSSSLTGAQAQHAVVPSGGEGYGSGGSFSYTIGQIVYQAAESPSASVSEGVQQAYEVSVVTGLSEISTFSIRVYPNPTADYLFLNMEELSGESMAEMSYEIMDMHGRQLIYEPIISNTTRIDMKTFAPAAYFLQINVGSQQIKSIKIIKNQ